MTTSAQNQPSTTATTPSEPPRDADSPSTSMDLPHVRAIDPVTALTGQTGLGRLAGLSGLSDVDALRITAAIPANHAQTTLDTYACTWRQWVTWCGERGVEPLPGSPAAVCAHLTERAAHGMSFATIEITCSATALQHRSHGLTEPTARSKRCRRRRAATSACNGETG